MGTVHVTFELWCNWSDKPPAYRVYINDDLMTERTYTFNNNEEYLEERVPLLTKSGAHFLTIVNLDADRSSFTIKNFKINGKVRDYREKDCRFVLNQDDLKV